MYKKRKKKSFHFVLNMLIQEQVTRLPHQTLFLLRNDTQHGQKLHVQIKHKTHNHTPHKSS